MAVFTSRLLPFPAKVSLYHWWYVQTIGRRQTTGTRLSRSTLGILHSTNPAFDWRCQRGHFTLGFGFNFSRTTPSRSTVSPYDSCSFEFNTTLRLSRHRTMPGVPSGRGCDACRKQKKKVRVAEFLLRRLMILDIDQTIVRHSKTSVRAMYETRTGLYRRRTATLQIHSVPGNSRHQTNGSATSTWSSSESEQTHVKRHDMAYKFLHHWSRSQGSPIRPGMLWHLSS